MDLLSKWSSWQEEGKPFVLPDDESWLRQDRLQIQTWEEVHTAPDFGQPGDQRFHLGLLPHPFCGDVANASIYVLMLNPGLGFQDYYGEYEVPAYREAVRATLRQEFGGDVLPFYLLDPRFAWHGGFGWWHKKLAKIIDLVATHWSISFAEARSRLASKLASIELVPYHSKRFNKAGGLAKTLPSAQLARRYVHDAVLPRVKAGEAIVVVTRMTRVWELPKLDGVIQYDRTEARGAHLGPATPGGRAIVKHLLRTGLG